MKDIKYYLENTSKDNFDEAIKLANNTKTNAFNLVMDSYEEIDGPLKGVPYALKDNVSTKGIRTTACSNTLANFVPVYDATVYKKLKEAGALLVGKTNLDELAMGGTGTTGNTGEVKNPWDTNRMAGGSSAGSAAAVAEGIVPFAIGSDTGDSIRKPAAYCGIVGYKPSYGLISRYGLFAFASSLDHLGVFSRNVYDAAYVTNIIKGHDDKDMTSITDMDDVNLCENINNDIKGKKLFYLKELCDKSLYSGDALKVMNNFFDNISKMKEAGFEVYEESFDINLLKAIKPVYDCLSCAEATSNDSNLTGIPFGVRKEADNVNDLMRKARTEGFSSLIKRRFVIGSFVLQKENQEKYFLNAKRVRRLIVEGFNELFKKYDALILPCSLGVAPLLKGASNKITMESVIMENHMAIGNFGGYPSITIPCGMIESMPIGLNITGAFKDDSNILNIANKIEELNNNKNQIAKGEK